MFFYFSDNLLESPNPTESDAEVIERQVIVKEERRRKKNRTKRRNSDGPRFPDSIQLDNGEKKLFNPWVVTCRTWQKIFLTHSVSEWRFDDIFK